MNLQTLLVFCHFPGGFAGISWWDAEIINADMTRAQWIGLAEADTRWGIPTWRNGGQKEPKARVYSSSVFIGIWSIFYRYFIGIGIWSVFDRYWFGILSVIYRYTYFIGFLSGVYQYPIGLGILSVFHRHFMSSIELGCSILAVTWLRHDSNI